jgi:two-component system sensor histidine kinase HupT/HoxJ
MKIPNDASRTGAPATLISRVVGDAALLFDESNESIWVDVIHRMDEVYSELLRNEADLERKNAELEDAQAFISSVIASVSDILIVSSEAGVIRQVNGAFLRLVGRDEADVVGSRISQFVLEEDGAVLRDLLASGREGKAQEADLRFRAANGEEERLAMRWSAQFNADRRRIGTVLTGRPISELRRAYQALHEAHVELQQAQIRLIEQEKMASLGRLVAGVAHELNNPISFVYGNIYTLERYRQNLTNYLDAIHRDPGAQDHAALRKLLKIDSIIADYKPLLEGTQEGASRVAEIVKNLRRLSFSKTSDKQAVDLDKVLRTAASLTARSKGARTEILTECEPGLTVMGHEGQIHQILVNLVDNALYAVKDRADGRITLSLRAVDEEAEIVISDNGVGIAEAVLGKIFEPFFTTKAVGEGTGLGLWISFSIIREYGGSISAANLPGGGARFTIRLPRGRVGPPEARPHQQGPA